MGKQSITSSLKCEAVARAFLGNPRLGKPGDGPELYFRCNQHDDQNESLKTNGKKNCWMCGPCGASGNAWELAAFLHGRGAKWTLLSEIDRRQVTAWLREHNLLPESTPSRKKGEAKVYPIIREFVYRDADGKPVAKRTRHDAPADESEARFKWWHPEKGEWKPNFSSVNRLSLYIGLPAPHDEEAFRDRRGRIEGGEETVYFTEGEHDADAGAQIGLLTVTSGGTTSIEILRRNVEQFRDKDVVVVSHPGSEEVKFAEQVAATLHGKAKSLRIIKPAGFWPTSSVKDLADIVEGLSAGGYTAETAREAIEIACRHAKEWKPTGGAELLDATYAFIRKFAKVTEAQARALTLWVAAAFIYQKWHYTSYLHIFSAERHEGKSTVLDVLWALLGVHTVYVRPSLASLFTDLDEHPGKAQLIDEIDKMFTGRKQDDDPILGYLTAGFQTGRTVPRTVLEGGKRRNVQFETFSPKVLCGRYAETLDDATRDRCIPIRMEKALWEDRVKRWVPKFHLPEGQQIGARLRVWCESIAEQAAKVIIPCALEVNQRVIDIWEPQLSVATVAAGDWLSWAKWSLIELHTGAEAEHDSRGVKLLKAIRPIRNASTEPEGITSTDLATQLHAIGGEWLEWGKAQKPITDNGIARILAPYGIRPDRIAIDGQRLRGYKWSEFDKLFARYLSRDSGTVAEPSEECQPSDDKYIVNQQDTTQRDGWTLTEPPIAVDPEKEMQRKRIKWFSISELRAIRRAQKEEKERANCGITVLTDTFDVPELNSTGPSHPRPTVIGHGGHETAMLGHECERRPFEPTSRELRRHEK